jgi:hypothetical protein
MADGVDAEDPDLATVGLAQPLQDLRGRRLAGSVGTEQSEIVPARPSKLTPSTARVSP